MLQIYRNTLISILVFLCTTMFAQNTQKSLKIFLNCEYCDDNHIKQNLTYVEFVRDQNFADVQLLFRSQKAGGGGTSYEIEFIGQRSYSDIQDKISFSSNADHTTNEIRDLIFKHIKIGLVRYWVKNGDQDNIEISLKKKESEAKTEVEDPWNKWVFNLGVSGYKTGEESSNDRGIDLEFSVKQVTAKNKFLLWIGISDDKSTFFYEDDEIVSIYKSKSAFLSDVISLNNHWSVGFFSEAGESSYSNKEFHISFKPGIEFNIFPYEESSKKGLAFTYKIGGEHFDYVEKTIFNKEKELLWEHSLSLGGSVIQKWGTMSGDISYESYLHDPSLKAFRFHFGTNLRLFKGFSFYISGDYDITDNQINLAAGDLSLEELLLRQQQVKSGYNYSVSMGINYSFGSIYNTIVNPRFDF